MTKKPNSDGSARAARRRAKRSLAKAEAQAARDRADIQSLEGRTPPKTRLIGLQEALALYGRACIERDAFKTERDEAIRFVQDVHGPNDDACDLEMPMCAFLAKYETAHKANLGEDPAEPEEEEVIDFSGEANIPPHDSKESTPSEEPLMAPTEVPS